jgi:hypothetical protein
MAEKPQRVVLGVGPGNGMNVYSFPTQSAFINGRRVLVTVTVVTLEDERMIVVNVEDED